MEENSIDPAPDKTADIETVKSDAISLSEKGMKFLSQTKPWVRFMSIIVFISVGFMVLGGLMMFLVGFAGNIFGKAAESYTPVPGGAVTAGLALAVLYIAPGIFLSRYAAAIKKLEASPDARSLEAAIKYQRSFWRYIGVITVFCLVVSAAVCAFLVAVALFNFINR
jgi:hypothetical protein